MKSSIAVRFTEHERYDINIDAEVVCFMAITGKGTYFSEVPLYGAKSLRDNRSAFKEHAIECIRIGLDPCEVDLNE